MTSDSGRVSLMLDTLATPGWSSSHESPVPRAEGGVVLEYATQPRSHPRDVMVVGGALAGLAPGASPASGDAGVLLFASDDRPGGFVRACAAKGACADDASGRPAAITVLFQQRIVDEVIEAGTALAGAHTRPEQEE